VYLRVDSLEQALRELCGVSVHSEGYELAYRLATENLQLGLSVVSDACNPVDVTRNAWRAVGENTAARLVNIEVVCSDAAEHRRRVEARSPNIVGVEVPTWEAVSQREYHPWAIQRVVIDTANRSLHDVISELVLAVSS